MTYSYALTAKKADSKGGVSYKIEGGFEVSSLPVDEYVRKVIIQNMGPRGAIIERVQGSAFREVLGIEGGVILRYHVSGKPAKYVLFHENGSLLPKPTT